MWLCLILALLLTACKGLDAEIPVAEALPPGATEEAPPAAFANGIPGLKTTSFWVRGFKWSNGDWDKAVAHAEALATKHGYHHVATPAVPNIERLGLTKEDVYQFWLSPSGAYGFGLMNFKLMREKGGSPDGRADYMLFCGGGSVVSK